MPPDFAGTGVLSVFEIQPAAFRRAEFDIQGCQRVPGFLDLPRTDQRKAGEGLVDDVGQGDLEDAQVGHERPTHRARLSGAGFNSCDVWFQCFNFASLVALK